MASVHKRPLSKYWHAAWRDSGGILRLRSTKQTNRSKALAVAFELERVDKKVGNGEMVESQIRRVLNDILERVGEPPLPTPTIGDWLREWIRETELNKSEGTAARYKGVIEGFIKSLRERASKPLTTVAPRDIQNFLTNRRKEERVSATTVNLDGKILRTCFNRARKQGIIPTNPAEAVELPARRSVERGIFTATELKLLLDTAKDSEWRTIILFGFYTGARLSDCTRMEWSKFDLVSKTISFFEVKNQKNILLPMHPDLASHLEKLAKSNKPQKFVTPNMAELGSGGRHGLSEGFKRIVVKAGLDLQKVQGNGVRSISKRTFHALRHSFTSALANAGVSPELRMKLTGHKSAEIHRGYTHLEIETLKSALEKLPGLVDPLGTKDDVFASIKKPGPTGKTS